MRDALPSRRALGLLGLVALLLLAGCEGPPPTYCEDCGAALNGVASANDVQIDEERSELHVHVREDGSSRYRIRTTLTEASARRVRENPRLLDQVAARVEDDHENVSVRMDGDTVVVAHEGPRMGRPGVGGVVVVDRFYDTEGTRGLRIAVDRVVIHGPPGTVVTRAPEEASVEDGAVAFDAGTEYDADIEPRTVVAFAPSDGPVSAASTRATVGLTVGGDVLFQLFLGLGFAVALLCLLSVVLLTAGIAYGDRIPLRAIGVVAVVATVLLAVLGLVGAGTFGVTATPVSGVVEFVTSSLAVVVLGVLAFVLLVVAAVAPLYLDRERVAPVVERGGQVLAGGSLLVLAAFVLFGVGEVAVLPIGLVAPALLFLPFGYAIGTESRDRWIYPPAVVLLPTGILLPFLPADVLFPMIAGLVLTPAWGIATALVGLVLFSSGYAVATGADPADLGLPASLPVGDDTGWG